MALAGWFVGPIMEKIINACSDYLEEQVGWQTGMKKELERLLENHLKIQAVVFAANEAQIISDQNPALDKWIWELRDAIDEADDVLDEFEYMKLKEQLTQNTEQTKKRKVRSATTTLSFLFESARKIFKIGGRGFKSDPNLKLLEESMQKLDEVSSEVATFLPLLDSAKQKHQKQLVMRETGYLPKNDLIGRGEEKQSVLLWLRKPSNDPRETDLYRNISLLSVVGHGGMGKTILLQHVYKEDEITKLFDLKMWVYVSDNFDEKKVIADMLESLKKKRPRLKTLEALQDSLRSEIMSKKFLLVLDDIWKEEENGDISKWENVLAPLADGAFGSRILVTTRTDSVAMMIATVIGKKTEIFRLEGLEEDHCLQLLFSHAFAGVENHPNDHGRLRDIVGEKVKKLLGSPLAAKVIGGVLKSNLDEGHWRKVLESNFFRHNYINSILRKSYIVLPNHLKNCFAFCCLFRQDHMFEKDDLVQMWISLGFIQSSLERECTLEDIGGRYFDILVKANFFYKLGDVGQYYKMPDLIYELAQSVSISEFLRVEDDTKFPSIIPKTLRHLSVKARNSNFSRKIGNLKYLRSLLLFCKAPNQDLCNALIDIFKASRSLRLLYVYAPDLKMIPKEIENLIHLRYLKIYYSNLTMLPKYPSNHHLQYKIYTKAQDLADRKKLGGRL